MSAKVRPDRFGGWVAICKDCSWASETGPMFRVDLWADVHNFEDHDEAAK